MRNRSSAWALYGLLSILAALVLLGCNGAPSPQPPPQPPPAPVDHTQECLDIHRQELGILASSEQVAQCQADFDETLNGDVARQRVIDREVPPLHAPGVRFPAVGASYYTSLTDPALNPRHFAYRLRHQLGVSFTRVWLLDAWAVAPNGPGQYDGLLPFEKVDPFTESYDLYAWSDAYFAHLRTYAEEMNRFDIVPIFTIQNLYPWSERKEGLLYVPDMDIGPWRNNVNAVHWEGDATLEAMPDAWQRAYTCRTVATLNGLVVALELGNEFPEKPAHERMRDHLREGCGYTGAILVNRQEDTPGQYDNMGIGRDYDGISFHGKASLEYLDEDYEREPEYRTFRDFYARGEYEAPRIFLSSDGARKSLDVTDAYDYPALRLVALDALSRGFNYEHQLAMKLRRFSENRLVLDDIAYDEAFIRELVAARPQPPAGWSTERKVWTTLLTGVAAWEGVSAARQLSGSQHPRTISQGYWTGSHDRPWVDVLLTGGLVALWGHLVLDWWR